MIKDLKFGMVKNLIKVLYNAVARKFGYFYDTHSKIITRITSDNIVQGHIRILGNSYNF